MLNAIPKEKLMKKVIAVLICGMFAALAVNTFAADAAAPAGTPAAKPATEKKHHDKHHDKAHKDHGTTAPAPAAPATDKK
jgi:hypothetical protein